MSGNTGGGGHSRHHNEGRSSNSHYNLKGRMNQLFVFVLICSKAVPFEQCNAQTARASLSYVAPPGIIVCGLPSLILTKATGPDASEYTRTRCVLRVPAT